jgi:hypothetical protein
MRINFEQVYVYGDNWKGCLNNLPDNSVICHWNSMSDKQNTYIIYVPNINEDELSDISSDGEGLAQVHDYYINGYGFIVLKNVNLFNDSELNIINVETFNEHLTNEGLFNSTYCNMFYSFDKLDKDIIDKLWSGDIDVVKFSEDYFNDINNLIKVYRLVGLGDAYDVAFKTTTLGNKDMFNDINLIYAVENDIRLCDLESNLKKPFKYIITKDSKFYDICYNNVIKKFS